MPWLLNGQATSSDGHRNNHRADDTALNAGIRIVIGLFHTKYQVKEKAANFKKQQID